MSQSTEGVVHALRSLVTFLPGQAGAFRELFGPVAEQLGPDIQSKISEWLAEWARAGRTGLVVLTGNAGTGKTAAAEAFCAALGEQLPEVDLLTDVGSALVAKDLSGLPNRSARAEAFALALVQCQERPVLLCVNEGILRDAAEDLGSRYPELEELLDRSLHDGIARDGLIEIINLNRQRLSAPDLWIRMLDFVSREEVWSNCGDCPLAQPDSSAVCPMRSNAKALRRPDTREALRHLIKQASGETVPTIREVLSLLAYAICGDASADSVTGGMWTCESARQRYRDRGEAAFTFASAYYNLLFGAGIAEDSAEKSPLLSALKHLEVGHTADLEIDEWLRDPSAATVQIQELAGMPAGGEASSDALTGSRSHLDRVRTQIGELTYHKLGETLSISEDSAKVSACVSALIDRTLPAQKGWRRRVFFEGSAAIGGLAPASSRLLALNFSHELFDVSQRVSAGANFTVDLTLIVRGLNYLVTGHADSSEGLIVPEPASLFARNPGAFRPARPAFVHSKVPVKRLRLTVPDVGEVVGVLDVDHVEVVLRTGDDQGPALTITPRIYQSIREAERFRGPVSNGIAEMTQLRTFYGRLADSEDVDILSGLLVADPERGALVTASLPHVAGGVE